MIDGMTITGHSSAELFPIGATVEAFGWHIARWYGPGAEKFPTHRDALVAGIAERESEPRTVSEDVFGDPVRGFSIDLRWNMKWEQGAPDANGCPTYSSGMEYTVQRYTYATLDAARTHLANIDRVAALVPLPVEPVTVHA